MILMFHCGAEEVEYDALRQLKTPEATRSHVPTPHYKVMDLVRYALGYHGREITEEHHGVTEDGVHYAIFHSLKSSLTNRCRHRLRIASRPSRNSGHFRLASASE